MTTELTRHQQELNAKHSLGVTSSRTLQEHRVRQQLRVLELNEMLHRKLDPGLLLECFFTELQAFMPIDGMEHRYPGSTHTLMVGGRRQHAKAFELFLGERSLGDMCFYRSSAFQPRQERQLERLLAGLTYPLRNALDYRDAVNETLLDNTTRIQNRLALERSLPREIMLSHRQDAPMSVLALDLDCFSQINEHHGIETGDQVLQTVAQTLSDHLRKTDMIYRYEVDKFIILLNGTEYSGAKVLAERIRRTVDTCFAYDNVQLVLSASAGITELTPEDTADKVIQRAFNALTKAKEAGGNTLRAIDGPTAAVTLV